jgi:DNA-binding CsgD family transcriptional regulator
VVLEQSLEAFDRAVLGFLPWTEALEAFASATGAHVGQIAGIDRHGSLIINMTSGVSDEQLAEYVASGGADPLINPRTRALLEAAPHRTVGESDFGDRDRFRHDPFYASFFARHEMPFCAMTKLIDTEEATVGVALLRSGRAGHVTADQRRYMDAAAPRLARTISAGITLERQKIDLIGGTLDHLTIPMFALNAEAQIVRMSPQAEALLAAGRTVRVIDGALAPVAADHRAPFTSAVAALSRLRPTPERRGTTLMLSSSTGEPSCFELIPLPIDSNGWLHAACCLVAIKASSWDRPSRATTLFRSCRLTKSERGVAELILLGHDVREISALRGVAESTVRNQIKALLGKTGFRRQIDFVRELGR